MRNNRGSVYAIEAIIILPALLMLWLGTLEVTSYLSFRNRCEQILFTLGDLLPKKDGSVAKIDVSTINDARMAARVMGGKRYEEDITHLSAVLLHRRDRKCWRDWRANPSDIALPPSGSAIASLDNYLCPAFAVDGVVVFKNGPGNPPPDYSNNALSQVKLNSMQSQTPHYNFAYTPYNNATNAYGATIRSLTYSICGIKDLLPSTGEMCAGFGGDRTTIQSPSFLSGNATADWYYNNYGGYQNPHPTPLVLTSYRPAIQDGQSFIVINLKAKYKSIMGGKLFDGLLGNVTFEKYFVSVPRLTGYNAQQRPIQWCASGGCRPSDPAY